MDATQEKDAISAFLNIEDTRTFIEVAMQHYQEQNMPGWFIRWLEDLYTQLGSYWQAITLDELTILSSLFTENVWTSPALAINRVYKLFDRLGRPIPTR